MGMEGYQNLFNKEPDVKCPACGEKAEADFVDNGFGAYAVQVSPYHCGHCGWSEVGCMTCWKEVCASWNVCQGRAVVKQDDNGLQ